MTLRSCGRGCQSSSEDGEPPAALEGKLAAGPFAPIRVSVHCALQPEQTWGRAMDKMETMRQQARALADLLTVWVVDHSEGESERTEMLELLDEVLEAAPNEKNTHSTCSMAVGECPPRPNPIHKPLSAVEEARWSRHISNSAKLRDWLIDRTESSGGEDGERDNALRYLAWLEKRPDVCDKCKYFRTSYERPEWWPFEGLHRLTPSNFETLIRQYDGPAVVAFSAPIVFGLRGGIATDLLEEFAISHDGRVRFGVVSAKEHPELALAEGAHDPPSVVVYIDGESRAVVDPPKRKEQLLDLLGRIERREIGGNSLPSSATADLAEPPAIDLDIAESMENRRTRSGPSAPGRQAASALTFADVDDWHEQNDAIRRSSTRSADTDKPRDELWRDFRSASQADISTPSDWAPLVDATEALLRDVIPEAHEHGQPNRVERERHFADFTELAEKVLLSPPASVPFSGVLWSASAPTLEAKNARAALHCFAYRAPLEGMFLSWPMVVLYWLGKVRKDDTYTASGLAALMEAAHAPQFLGIEREKWLPPLRRLSLAMKLGDLYDGPTPSPISRKISSLGHQLFEDSGIGGSHEQVLHPTYRDALRQVLLLDRQLVGEEAALVRRFVLVDHRRYQLCTSDTGYL